MLENVLLILKKQLNNYLKIKTGDQGFEAVFLQERTNKDISFRNDAITVLLVNLEEEYTFRSGATLSPVGLQQTAAQANPNIYINLYVLFAANFTDYSQSLKFLSLIIKFFQSHRLFDRTNSPDLSSDIEKLTLELVNVPFSEQRDIWTYLGMSYMPSAIYKVRMLTFSDTDTVVIDSDIAETEFSSSNI